MSLYNLYVANGFQSDCDKLIGNFLARKSLLFKDFVEEWKNLKFPLIYCGRHIFIELWEFIEETFVIAKRYLFQNSDINFRIGGLYLLYALYFNQPTKDYASKIRITYDDWKILLDFQNILRTKNHIDALYILCKLRIYKSFIFVISERTYGLERTHRKYHSDIPIDTLQNQPFSFSHNIKDSYINNVISSLEILNDKYHQVKSTLPGSTSLGPADKSLRLVQKNIAHVLQKTNIATKQQKDPLALTSSSDESETECIGKKRSNIRKRAFRGEAKYTYSRIK